MFGKNPPKEPKEMPRPQLPRVAQLPEEMPRPRAAQLPDHSGAVGAAMPSATPVPARRQWHPQALQFGQQIAEMEDRIEHLRQERDAYERRAMLAEETIEHLKQRLDEERMEHRNSLGAMRAQNEHLRDMHAVLKTKIEAGAKIFLGCLENAPLESQQPQRLGELPKPPTDMDHLIGNLEREIAKPPREGDDD